MVRLKQKKNYIKKYVSFTVDEIDTFNLKPAKSIG